MKVLGIDIGGSGVKGAIVDTDLGKFVSERHRIPTPHSAKPEPVARTVLKVVNHFKWQGIVGCGFPAVIQHGVARTASNIDKSWIDTNVAELFSKTTKCKTHVLNDADAAGIAEMKCGAGKNKPSVVIMLTVGTGIGSGLFLDGRLFPNTEFGQFLLEGDVAEKYAADSVRKDLDLSWKKWGKRLNKYLNHLEMLLWPDLIILGGGVSKKFEKYSKYFELQAEIQPAQLKNEAGIIGAAIAASEAFS
ncbi:MAG: ROK family protein [Calditrichota bacterium]|jgi:polyphosphate glucokinase